jgi:1,2-diacylglycerol 3-alpha-glucosyltransferase/glucuronosyltransferase
VRILIASDAWPPQVNGVVRTLKSVLPELDAMGHAVTTLTPDMFRSVACPFYPEIRLAFGAARPAASLIERAQPDAIHIVTEGPVGFAVRRWCVDRDFGFTTAYHTRFPEYLAARCAIPSRLTYGILRRFHAPARGIMVATESMRQALSAKGFHNLRPWSRGVDPSKFNPDYRQDDIGFPRPIFISVGRVAMEKNLPAFLGLDLPGSKLVVGEGPQLERLKRKYPAAHFLGHIENGALARLYASADVFVFPSRTDTFGLVLLEALASGLPVAAFPVPGPLDVIGDSVVGVLSEDLRAAALAALDIPRAACREHALRYTWEYCARQFVEQLSVGR